MNYIPLKHANKEPKITAVHHVLILDSSGSMVTIREATRLGYNEQIQTIKNLADADKEKTHTITTVIFNTTQRFVLFNSPARLARELTLNDYVPNGGTALCDTIGIVFKRVLRECENDHTNVLVTVLTDGDEIDSKQYNRGDVKDLIHTVEKMFGWTVTYIGANQDMEAVHRDFGIARSNTAFYTADVAGATNAFSNMSKSRATYSTNSCGAKSATHGLYNDKDEAADFNKA